MVRVGLILRAAFELLDDRDDSPPEKVLRRIRVGAGVGDAIFYLASEVLPFVSRKTGECREQNLVFVFDVGVNERNEVV
jgi:hypothetical protein